MRRLRVRGGEQWREAGRKSKLHSGSLFGYEARWGNPSPRRALAPRERPRRREMVLAATRLGDDGVADEEAELDADASEANSFAACLGRRRDVVETAKVGAPHPLSVIND